MVDFGYPIGPFATADLLGLAIGYDSSQDFTIYRGQLMYWAKTIGVAEVYRQIQAWHQQ
jgi:3-hydroxyacyl-CoA dehydrogenase